MISSKWDKYKVSDSEEMTTPSLSEKWNQYISTPKTGSTGEIFKESALGLGRIAARGGAALLSAPSKMIGGGLSLLSEMGDVGRPGTKMLQSAGKYLSGAGEEGEKNLLKLSEYVLGKPYGEGEEFLSKLATRAGHIYGSGPFKGTGGPAIIGATAGQTAEELGAGPGIQTLAEILGMSGKDLGKAISSLKTTPETAKSGLQLPKIVESVVEKFKGLKPKIFASKKEKLLSKITSQAEDLIGKIRSEEIPISKEIEKGIDVTARNEANLNKVGQIAENLPDRIESNFISDYLDNIESEIMKTPVPTEEQEKILKLINKYKSSYGTAVGGTRFYLPKEYYKQFRNINKDLKELYQTKFVHGDRIDTMKFYEGLKDSIEKTLESGTPKEFSELFKSTNLEYSSLKKLEKFDKIIEEISDATTGALNTKKLQSFIQNGKKANILRQQIGHKGFEKLKSISNDLTKVKNKMDLIETIGIKDVLKSSITGGLLTYLGFPLVKTYQLGKGTGELLRGYMLTSPQGSRNISNFLKAIRSGSKKIIIRSLIKLDDDVRKYFESNQSTKTEEQK